MGVLEGLLYVIWRGFAIGVIISAPMGPVGILCIQRTLDKGRKTGLYTGIGAAISDLIYCLLTGFGLSFVEEFLEKNQNVIQLLGSIVLIAFGLYLFKSNPSRKLKKPAENRVSAKKNILNGFLFTFSNPLIIFLIIGLFARFNFLLPEIKIYHYMVGFLFIVIGALTWWYLVTYFVDKVRAHFNLRSMWLINKIIGSIILLFALVGTITAVSGMVSAKPCLQYREDIYLNSRRGFGPLTGDSIFTLTAADSKADSAFMALKEDNAFTFSFRLANEHNRAGKKYHYIGADGKRHSVVFPGWSLILKGKKSRFVLELRTIDNTSDNIPGIVGMSVKALNNGKEVFSTMIKSGFDLYGATNSYILYAGNGKILFRGGNRAYSRISEIPYVAAFDSIGFAVSPGGKVRIDDISIEYEPSKIFPESAARNIDSLLMTLKKSGDPMEGIWEEFDRNLDESQIRMGGRYRFAIEKNPSGYTLIYLSGAGKNPAEWKRGMVKGKLRGTSFSDIYDLEWITSEGDTYPSEIKAQRENDIITIQFPYQNSTLRLSKVPSN